MGTSINQKLTDAIKQAAPGAVREKDRLEIITGSQLECSEVKPVEWIVPGLIPAGLTMVAGRPKCGKSFLALMLAISIATGALFWNLTVRRRKVFYWSLEDSPARLKNRILMLTGSAVPADISFSTRLPDGGKMFSIPALERYLAENRDIDFAIVDTLGRIKVQPAGRGNSYEIDYEYMSGLHEITKKTGCSIIVLHHLKKGQISVEDPFDCISGSNGILGTVDAAIVIQSDRNNPERILHITGRDIEEKTVSAMFKDGIWSSCNTDPGYLFLSPENKRLIEILSDEDHTEGLRPAELAKMTNRKRPTVSKALITLESKGLLIRDAKTGCYQLPRPEPPAKEEEKEDTGVCGGGGGGVCPDLFPSTDDPESVTAVTGGTVVTGFTPFTPVTPFTGFTPVTEGKGK